VGWSGSRVGEELQASSEQEELQASEEVGGISKSSCAIGGPGELLGRRTAVARGGRWRWLAAADGGGSPRRTVMARGGRRRASGLRMVGARGSRQRGAGRRASAPPGVGQRGMGGTMGGGGHQPDVAGWEGGEK
jgi:hypothetical protein